MENDYNTPVSLKRSLSDPEIYFPSAVRCAYNIKVERNSGTEKAKSHFLRHSLIVAVNGIVPQVWTLLNLSQTNPDYSQDRKPPESRSLNGDSNHGGKNGGDGRGGGGGDRRGGGGGGQGPRSVRSTDRGFLPLSGDSSQLQIDINVIQPTPNISPSHSLRSFSVEEREGIESGTTFAGETENSRKRRT